MKYPLIVAAAALMMMMMMAACAPDDRCGDDYDFVDGICVTPDTDSDSDSETTTDPPTDGGDTDEGSGIGETCTPTGDECDDLEADYCAAQPGADEGYCTLDNCAADESICPSPYQCCDMGTFSFCASELDFETMDAMGMCGG